MQTLAVESAVLTERDFRKISGLVYRHCGINLHDGKKELVRARLSKRLRAGNFRTFSEYTRHVLEDKTGKEFSILIDVLSTNLTGFFREKQHFDFLNYEFIPQLLQHKKQFHNFKIRGWSAGCSSGEEPYSMAITLLEAVQGMGQWDVKVLATDISTSMLETAQKGIYNTDRITPVAVKQRRKYLKTKRSQGKKMFEVSKKLRNVVIFRYLNLVKDWPIRGPLDFIFCRNVMIYFDKATQTRLVKRFWDILDSGGVLFTGHSESLTAIKHNFKYIQPTIYMKP